MEEVVETFRRDGLAVVKNFADKETVEGMMKQMDKLLEGWEPSESKGSVFCVDEGAHVSNAYFFESSDKIRFFLEPGATENGILKEGFNKKHAVHKVGHGLHFLDPVFKEYSTSRKVKEVVHALGYKDPVLPQSMYIFKQKEIGDAAVIHQDSTFLYTTPKPTCLGLWLALQDSTMENGCLWGRPGSQNDGVRRIFKRNPEYFQEGKTVGDDVPALIFENLPGVAQYEHEGRAITTEEEARALGFVPCPVSAGDLVLIHGEVDHMSFPNKTPISRHTFQLHLVEGPGEGITWAPTNWLQYPDGRPFPSLALDKDA
eukprot:TRINITY_DN33912_c0_g1_i1.p1 TRINITY_DN33912_c0_g1~~TRINITY_DN33912_c0_g1_i1.p1  ORF type:complete len:315 (+),score=66.50 TRINITY_DN33912_c0_g1_i1:61-1005(+)